MTKTFLLACCMSSTLVPLVASAQEVIEPSGEVELVKGGFEFTEGPASDAKGNLFFSDIPPAKILRLAVDGTFTVFSNDSKHTNGMVFTADGRLLGCQMDGAVVEYDLETGKVAKTLADTFEGKRFNAPNDLVVDQAGGVYFTDPLYRAPASLPQQIQAVYYIAKNASKDATVSRVSKAIDAPNGIGLSPDGKRLYVIPSMSSQMLAYDVLKPGQLGDPVVLCTVRQPVGQSSTGGDGMAVDTKGNLYITTHIGVQIFSAEGAAIGLIKTPEQPANAAFGGPDRKTLYITARSGLYKVAMPIAGLPPN